MVRADGEKANASGKVVACGWCEAVVQRSPAFIDSANAPETPYTSINALKKTFDRRVESVLFRWLSGKEA